MVPARKQSNQTSRRVPALKAVADNLCTQLHRTITFDDPTDADLITMWTIASKMSHIFPAFPYLRLTSDEGGAGKTATARVIVRTTGGSLQSALSGAAIKRVIRDSQTGKPRVVAIDEFDNLFESRRVDRAHLYQIFNGGFNNDGKETVCSPDNGTLDPDASLEFSLYSPKIFVGLPITDMKSTLASRCIDVHMRQQTDDEYLARVGSFDNDEFDKIAEALDKKITTTVEKKVSDCRRRDRRLPNGTLVKNRNEELWGPLSALAEYLGGDWLDRLYECATKRIDTPDEQTRPTSSAVDDLDNALRIAMRSGKLGPQNYAKPGKTPLLKGLGVSLADFGFEHPRLLFQEMSLYIDKPSRTAQLRWKSNNTSIVAKLIGDAVGARYSDRHIKNVWKRAGRLLLQTPNECTYTAHLFEGSEKRERLIVLDISDWFTWSDTTDAHSSIDSEEMP